MAPTPNALRQRARRGTTAKPCIGCGKEFDREDLRLDTCSEECRWACHIRSIRKHLGIPTERFCIECGEQMDTNDFRVQQCSEECRLRRQRRQKQFKRMTGRAKQYGLLGEPFTEDDLQAWLDERGRACVYCGGPYEAIDHIIPYTRGGLHELANLNPSCKPCNASKGNRLLSEWEGRMPNSECAYTDCGHAVVARGWCARHYYSEYYRHL